MARLTITEHIFENKILAKVCKLVVAADSNDSKQNRTISTCQKSKVVNLRFFFVIFFHFFFLIFEIFSKNRKFTTFVFSDNILVRLVLNF